MRRASPTPVIAVWGHFHGGNLGDDLVVSTIIDAARRRVPGATIIGISLDPADTSSRHGIPAYPINPGSTSAHQPSLEPEPSPRADRLRTLARRVSLLRRLRALEWTVQHGITQAAHEVPFLWHSYRLLHRIDLIVVAGSGVFTDDFGVWRHPYTSFRWSLLARHAGASMVYSSVGAGPIHSTLGSFFIRGAIARSDRISVRDRDTAHLLASNGVPGPLPIVPDMAFGLPQRLRGAAAQSARPDGAELVVGLNVMAYQDPRYLRKGADADYLAYVDKMAAFAEWLLDEGHTVKLFSSQTQADALVAEDVQRVLEARGRLDSPQLRCVIDQTDDVEDLIEVITSCDLIVAARFHAVLIALLFDIPVLGLAYHQKTAELLIEAGQPERFLDIGASTGSDLREAFRALRAGDSPAKLEEQRARVARHRAMVEQQFDTIFAPLGPAPAADRPAVAAPPATSPKGEA